MPQQVEKYKALVNEWNTHFEKYQKPIENNAFIYYLYMFPYVIEAQ